MSFKHSLMASLVLAALAPGDGADGAHRQPG
jgi:hypothetical protein